MFYRGHHPGWHPWLGLGFLLLVGVAVGFAVWALVRLSRPTHHFAGPAQLPHDPALETLRVRFARGEIDAAEFTARAAHLSGAVPPAPPAATAAPASPAPPAPEPPAPPA